MSTKQQTNKSLLAQVFDALWSDPQVQEELFSLVEEVAEDIVTWEYVVDWILLKAAAKLPGKVKQLGDLNCSPLVDFLQAYIEKGSKTPTSTVKANIVEVALTAQAFVKGSLTLEVPPELSQEKIVQRVLSRAGDVVWTYNGTIDGTERVEKIEQVGQVLK